LERWIVDTLLVVLVAFVPSLVYLIWIRNTEKYSREPYGRLFRVFAYGAVVSVIVAIVFELVFLAFFNRNIERVYQVVGENPNLSGLVLACVIAPIVEEISKALGIFRVRKFFDEIENGLVYGAAAGLGFAATENLLYEGTAFVTDGTQAWISVVVIRSLASALLHATTSSVFGLGIAGKQMNGTSWAPYYLAAVMMHAIFNFAASFGVLYSDSLGDLANLVSLIVALTMAFSGIAWVRLRIKYLDTRHRRR
jgi:RsiW-degrading membrane proteinase PrsW (M82 family)